MNEIIEILMIRDGISREEAIEAVMNCIYEIADNFDYDSAVDSIEYWLGLEPDYLEILLNEM